MSAATASILAALAALMGAVSSFMVLELPHAALGAALALWLGLASYIDVRSFLLLDVLTLPLALLGLLIAFVGYGPTMLESALGAALGYTVLWALAALYRRARGHDGLGLGDAKLLAAAGAWCGALALPSVMLIASLSALVCAGLAMLAGQTVNGQFKLPFGPFLSIGFLVTWIVRSTGQLGLPIV